MYTGAHGKHAVHAMIGMKYQFRFPVYGLRKNVTLSTYFFGLIYDMIYSHAKV